jgi:hypothetical protein
MTQNNNLPKWFNTVAILAIIWNVLGVVSYLFHVTLTAESMSNKSVIEQALYTNIPSWRISAFAIATFGGLIGSILLIMKKKIACAVFAISLIAILAGIYYDFFMINTIEVIGLTAIIFPMIIVLIGIFLIWVSKKLN